MMMLRQQQQQQQSHHHYATNISLAQALVKDDLNLVKLEAPPIVTAQVYYEVGRLREFDGHDYNGALDAYSRALELYEEEMIRLLSSSSGSANEEAIIYAAAAEVKKRLGCIFIKLKYNDLAISMLQQAAAAFRDLISYNNIDDNNNDGDDDDDVVVLYLEVMNVLGEAYYHSRKYDEAVEAWTHCYDGWVKHDQPVRAARVLNNLGAAYAEQGYTQDSLFVMQEAISIFKSHELNDDDVAVMNKTMKNIAILDQQKFEAESRSELSECSGSRFNGTCAF